MILLINRTRIKNWKYISKRERGYCLGFYWKLLSSFTFVKFYELTRENGDGYIIIHLASNTNKSTEQIIEDYILNNFNNVLREWNERNKYDRTNQ